ncbi:hypothetical protein F4678DRAFT_460739 [Xylaria arbuscula]|nr:hypothetical protein F4678DRAFT_460739 [Xylaria arbuscula]
MCLTELLWEALRPESTVDGITDIDRGQERQRRSPAFTCDWKTLELAVGPRTVQRRRDLTRLFEPIIAAAVLVALAHSLSKEGINDGLQTRQLLFTHPFSPIVTTSNISRTLPDRFRHSTTPLPMSQAIFILPYD